MQEEHNQGEEEGSPSPHPLYWNQMEESVRRCGTGRTRAVCADTSARTAFPWFSSIASSSALACCFPLPIMPHAPFQSCSWARVSTDNAGIRLRSFAEVRAQRAAKNDLGVLPVAR